MTGTRPVILVVDDDRDVLQAVARDVRARYGEDHRIVTADGGPEALDAVEELKRRGERLALLLVDQRMPEMTGTELLARNRSIYPDAKTVLLTAYADTDAAIAAINEVSLDHYLMKPWDPPDRELYPVLDGLLDDWARSAPATIDGIRVVGHQHSPDSFAVKDWLARNRVPYRWLDLERDPEAGALLQACERSPDDLPLVVFPDGEVLAAPDHRGLAAKLGRPTTASLPMYDLVIVGAGPAGLGAAVYGASEGLSCVLVECRATGGQAGTSSHIDNYLGFPSGLTGADLAARATAQAARFGCEILSPAEVVRIRTDESYRYAVLEDGSELACRSLIVATGMTTRRLERPGVDRLTGRGVYYGAAVTEALSYRDAHVLVVGGANSAGQGAMLFSRYARKVTIIVRGAALEAKMSDYLVRQIRAADNLEVRTSTVVEEVLGDDRVTGVRLRDTDADTSEEIDATGVFVFVGAAPHSDLLDGVVELDADGFVVTGPDLLAGGRRPAGWALTRDPYLLETSVPGIFAAGDITHGAVRRVASAVGAGAVAVSHIHQYLTEV